MKSLSLTKIGGAFFLAGLACACLSLAMSETLSPMKAASDTPAFIMNAEKNRLFEAEEIQHYGHSPITSEAGTEVEIAYINMLPGSEGIWHGLSTSGYISNTEEITGLESLSFILSGTGSINIIWSAELGSDVSGEEAFTAEDGQTYTCHFNNEYPKRFMFSNKGDSSISIVSITITFTCSDVNPS